MLLICAGPSVNAKSTMLAMQAVALLFSPRSAWQPPSGAGNLTFHLTMCEFSALKSQQGVELDGTGTCERSAACVESLLAQ